MCNVLKAIYLELATTFWVSFFKINAFSARKDALLHFAAFKKKAGKLIRSLIRFHRENKNVQERTFSDFISTKLAIFHVINGKFQPCSFILVCSSIRDFRVNKVLAL